MSDDSREVASPAPRRSLAQDSLSSDDNGTHQLAVAVDDLLDQLQSKFDKVSSEIFEKSRWSPRIEFGVLAVA
ncbi:hypothetical protein KEM55_002305 [Ascosphaera atra]|nr:hypothetical protein KEM55_002305 [Ascosphaera atra]